MKQVVKLSAFILLVTGTLGLLINEFIFDWGSTATLTFAALNVMGLAILAYTYLEMMCILALLTKGSFRPTPKDVENDELKTLAKRLKGDSEKETLTNILEWQDRNIQPWWERWPLVPIFLILILILVLITLLSLLLFSPIFRLLIAGILAMVIISMMVSMMGYLYIRYGIFLREKSIKEKISRFKEVVEDTFRLSLPVDKIIKSEKYRLAVCRDYAKLTASLLFRVYPDSEVYFITIPRHVAAGIKIKNKIYVLDQRLPILTKDDWQNKEEACTYISKLKRDPNGGLEVTFKRHKTITIEEKKVPINTEKLTEEIAEIFGIEPSSHINKPDLKFEIPPINYEDDEITKYSLIRKIKNRLEREFCGNTDKMLKVNISQDKISVKIKET